MKPAHRDAGDGEDTGEGAPCPVCGGSGRQPSGADCPDCDGTGLLGDDTPQRATQALGLRKRRARTIKGTIERRDFPIGGLECRGLDDGMIRMTGYGSVTEHPYEVNGFTETVRRGAFKRTLSENPDVVLLFGHEGMPLARTKAGSLALEENARGLYWTADLDAEDPESRAVARKVSRGLIDQCSFAFLVTDQAWSDDYTERSIKSVSLHRGDVSLVAQGANDATGVEVLAARAARAARSKSVAPDQTTRLARAQLQQVRDRESLKQRSQGRRSYPARMRPEAAPSMDRYRQDLDRAKRRVR